MLKRYLPLLLTLSLAENAYSEVVLTPRVSHSYEKIQAETSYHISDEPDLPKDRSTGYLNTTRFDLELSVGTDHDMGWLVNLGYAQLPETQQDSEVFALDLGLRKNLGGFYSQFTLGAQYFNISPDEGKGLELIVPNAGLGLGYMHMVDERLGLEIFYRGTLNLAESNKEKNFDYTFGYAETRLKTVESHQLGLGLGYKF